MRAAIHLGRRQSVDITHIAQPRLLLQGRHRTVQRDGQRISMCKPSERGVHFVRYPSETAGARNGGPGKSPCHFWAKRPVVSSFAAAYNLRSEHAQGEQERPSGGRADVVLPGPVRSEAFEVQLVPITLLNFE